MTKAVSNRDICFIKAVLLWCEHGLFLLFFALHGLSCTPPHKFRVKGTVHRIYINGTGTSSRIRFFYVFFFNLLSIPLATVVNLMVLRVGPKWSNSNGAIGPIHDTKISTVADTGIERK